MRREERNVDLQERHRLMLRQVCHTKFPLARHGNGVDLIRVRLDAGHMSTAANGPARWTGHMRACLEHQAEQFPVSIETRSAGRHRPKVGKVGGCRPALGQLPLCSVIGERRQVSTADFGSHHDSGDIGTILVRSAPEMHSANIRSAA